YHSWHGVLITYGLAILVIIFIQDPFEGLIYSQMFLSIQLPITIFLLIYLTSSKKIMGKFVNGLYQKIILIVVGIIVTCLNLILLWEIFYK
ncbi:divalent metal cation transporter, partial [uncultured Megamonas sp.]